MFELEYDHKEQLNNEVWTFYFHKPEDFDYQAGQYIQVALPIVQPDSRGSQRWFTLSSSPAESMLTITTKLVPNPSSFKRTLSLLPKGFKIKASSAMGDFVLPKDPTKLLLFLVGGIGITPVKSIAGSLVEKGEHRDIELIYAAGYKKDLMFLDILASAGIRTNILLSQDVVPGIPRGHLELAKIQSIVPSIPRRQIYISGPEKLVNELATVLIKQGFLAAQIIRDGFPGYHIND